MNLPIVGHNNFTNHAIIGVCPICKINNDDCYLIINGANCRCSVCYWSGTKIETLKKQI